MHKREVAERIRKARHYLEPTIQCTKVDRQMNEILNALMGIQVRMESETANNTRKQ